MEDLKLWKLLHQPERTTPAVLTVLLRQLARIPAERRVAFLGLLEPFLRYPQAEVRAAAVSALAGAHGIPAWRGLVAGLNDPDPKVRAQAVEALHLSAAHDAPRWVHALFHPLPDVRALARKLGAPPSSPPSITSSAPARAEIDRLMASSSPSEAALRELIAFLDSPADENHELRIKVAKFLSARKQLEQAFPVLVQASPADSDLIELLGATPADSLALAANGVTILGSPEHENLMVKVLDKRARRAEDEEATAALLTQATQISVRRWARDKVPASPMRNFKLARLAHTFAWGVDVGRILTGEKFQVRLLVGEQDMGYTRLKENKIFVTGQPILRGERFGTAVVRGLIVHEYGHHMYHKGPGAEDVDKEARAEKLEALYNLVQDEHLERNLRKTSSRYGDMLKILASYAFLHSKREVPVQWLLGHLGESAPDVLPHVTLGAARKPGHVVVASGRLMRALEDAGHSFARFVRALRTGLGNRHGDSKVAQGLELFKSGFRKSTLPELLDVARKLREIFGDETDILKQMGQDTLMAEDEAGTLDTSDGITPDAVQEAVDDLLPGRKPRDDGEGKGWSINTGPEETFQPITKIEKLQPDPAEHAAYAKKVMAAARQLRRYFEDLGLVVRPQRRRLQGRQLDRGRVRDLVLRGEPRVLMSRQTLRSTDLYIGVAIDCSGSMSGAKMEKAKLFGTLLAEALRGHKGVDLRLFGFEHNVIWDAGNATRCAVHRLRAGGGNNDAAALAHVAQVGRSSKRRAKLLVMISDGMPTDCTVNALKTLVRKLTRQRYCCAQVAVQPLSEVCFPHYVLLEDQDFDASVNRFGRTVARLVGRALAQA
jgi:Mg-chelatase subunit ChlD